MKTGSAKGVCAPKGRLRLWVSEHSEVNEASDDRFSMSLNELLIDGMVRQIMFRESKTRKKPGTFSLAQRHDAGSVPAQRCIVTQRNLPVYE